MGFYSYLTRVPCASPSPLGTKPPRRLLLLLQLLPPPPPLRYSPTTATPTPGALARLTPTYRADRVPAARPAQCGAISSSSPAPRFPLPYSTGYENGVALPLPSLRRLALITQASGAGRRRGAQIREPSLTQPRLRAALCRLLRKELAGRYRLSRSHGWIARTSPDRQPRISPARQLSEAGPGRVPSREPPARLRAACVLPWPRGLRLECAPGPGLYSAAAERSVGGVRGARLGRHPGIVPGKTRAVLADGTQRVRQAYS